MRGIAEKVYCAFCRLERRVHTKKAIGWTNVVLAFFGATVVGWVLWQQLDPRMIIVFVLFIIAAEIFVRVRWRMSLPCPHCGFDPLLYKIDREQTVRRVKARLTEVRNSSKYLLRANNPLEKLPKLVVEPPAKRGAQLPAKSAKPAPVLSRHA